VPPQKPTVQQPKPEDGINDLAKGNFTQGQPTNKQDPNKKLVLTVGKELEGQLQSLKQDGPKRRRSLSVGGVS
jgi:hypothetical protein